eukprot:COSAG05_NODE_2577_length_2878_cov_215.916877_2_plen_191_part_00
MPILLHAAFSTISSSDSDTISIEGQGATDSSVPCLTARFADGRPKLSTTVKDQDTSHSRVVFDVATTPLPVGEYLVRLDSRSKEDEMAMTYFVVMPAYGATYSFQICLPVLLTDPSNACPRTQNADSVTSAPIVCYAPRTFAMAPKSAAHAAPGTTALSVLATPARNAQVRMATGWQHASQPHLAVACTF